METRLFQIRLAYSGYQSHATLSRKTSRQNVSLVDVNHLRLLADLPEKRVQSETLQRSTRKNDNFTFAMYG